MSSEKNSARENAHRLNLLQHRKKKSPGRKGEGALTKKRERDRKNGDRNGETSDVNLKGKEREATQEDVK